MAEFTSPLDRVKVASPCPAAWNQMFGNERVRFCSQCKLNVYNLSDMTRSEAEALLNRTEERLCVRFFRRADGTILTQNCPVGLKAIKRRLTRAADAALWMVLSLISGLGLYSVSRKDPIDVLPLHFVVMGDIAPIRLPAEPEPAMIGVMVQVETLTPPNTKPNDKSKQTPRRQRRASPMQNR